MNTIENHGKLINIDDSGNQYVLYPKTFSDDVYTDTIGTTLSTILSNMDTAISGKAASSHTHDDRYYTESEIKSITNTKADSSVGFNATPANTTWNAHWSLSGANIASSPNPQWAEWWEIYTQGNASRGVMIACGCYSFMRDVYVRFTHDSSWSGWYTLGGNGNEVKAAYCTHAGSEHGSDRVTFGAGYGFSGFPSGKRIISVAPCGAFNKNDPTYGTALYTNVNKNESAANDRIWFCRTISGVSAANHVATLVVTYIG